MLENYTRIVKIEALTMLDMASKEIYPAINNYVSKLLEVIELKKSNGINASTDLELANKLSDLNSNVYRETQKLRILIEKVNGITEDYKTASLVIKDEVLPCMEELRKSADEAETLTDEKYWPYPSYAKLLFSVK